MRRVLAAAALAVVLTAGVVRLAEATQNRPDPASGGGNDIVLSIRTRAGIDPEKAATALWAACQHTVSRTRLVALSPAGVARFRLALAPALGEHGRRRLVGCLEDATLDRIVGDVEAFRTQAGEPVE